MRYLLLLPSVLIFALFFANAAFQVCRAARKARKAEAARRARAEAAECAKAERDAQKAAAKAARAAEAQARPKRKRGRPRKEHAPVPQADAKAVQIAQPVQAAQTGKRPETIARAALQFKGNNAFAGEVVAFTGTLDGMTRAEAIKAVEDNGGRAFETMPAGTTMLVVGSNPGMNKLDKADRWIGQVRKITQEHFRAMLTLPLTLTPDEFAAHFAPTNQQQED